MKTVYSTAYEAVRHHWDWFLQFYEWCSRQSIEEDLTSAELIGRRGTCEATGALSPADLDSGQIQLLCNAADAPYDSEKPPRIVAVSSVVIKEGGRYASHRSYDLQRGCIVKDIESDDDRIYIISKILLFNNDCYSLCDILQLVRLELPDKFPVYTTSSNQAIVSFRKLSKAAAYCHHTRNNTFSIINLHALWIDRIYTVWWSVTVAQLAIRR